MSSSALAATVQGVRALISAYDGYEKGRFMKSDEAVRAEIQRRCEMVARHAEKLREMCTKQVTVRHAQVWNR